MISVTVEPSGILASVLRGAALRTKASYMYRSEMGESQYTLRVLKAV